MGTVELGPPGPGEVTVEVPAAGMNPVDDKHFEPGQDPSVLLFAIGDEVYEAPKAVAALMGRRPDGKLALVA
jgi:NADPH:quinone reductase-like Zn-dependent oxidoreductase